MARYGWTMWDITHSPVEIVMDLIEHIVGEKQQEHREKLVISSYTAWQILAGLGGYKKSFKEHLRILGLNDPEEKQEVKADPNECLRNAIRIRQMDKRNWKHV